MIKKPNFVTILSVVLFFILTNPPFGCEIEVKKEILTTEGEIENTDIEHIVRITPDNTNEYGDTHVEIFFDESKGEFEKSLSIAIKQTLEKYRFCAINARIPFYEENAKLDFVLFGHMITPGARSDIRALRSVDPNSLGTERLFQYYAKSRVQARYVLTKVSPEDRVTRDNVKAVYSFLQATNNLAKIRYIHPDEIGYRSAEWLTQACKRNENTCNSAVGEKNRKQVITEFSALDAYRYEKLYDEILNLRTVDLEAYCEMLLSLQNAFEKMQDDEIKRINRRRITAQVALAVAGCIAKWAKKECCDGLFSVENRHAVIRNQTLILEQQLKVASGWPSVEARLKGHKQDLQNLLRE